MQYMSCIMISFFLDNITSLAFLKMYLLTNFRCFKTAIKPHDTLGGPIYQDCILMSFYFKLK